MFLEPEPVSSPAPEAKPHPPELAWLGGIGIGFYVMAVMVAAMACFPLIHVGVGVYMVVSPETFCSQQDCPPGWFGWIFILIGLLVVLAGWSWAICTALAGYWIHRRKRYLFCFVMAVLSCLMMPLGTILGVFALLALVKDEIKAEFSV